MDLTYLIWIILGILVLVTVVAAITAGISRRKALREGSKPAEVDPTPTKEPEATGEEKPEAGATSAPAPALEPEAPSEPRVETPEAAGSRMARLRRRLANSNNLSLIHI